MKTLFFSILALLGICIPASAITVTTPANGAQVTSPFTLTASTSTCGSVPVVSMGYSIDSGKAVIESTSFTDTVTATPGAHVLHVKCWGKQVSDQVLLNITVVAPPAPAPAPAPAPGPDITVSSPASGATLTSPFTVAANSSTCASSPTASMGYSIDGGHTTTMATPFSTSVTANPGQHVLTVKCTGQSGTNQTSLNIHVVPPPTAATPKFSLPSGKYTTKQVVALSDATPGSVIYYTLDGSGPSTSSLQYSGPIAVTGNLTIEAIAVAPGYSKSGLGRADYSIVAPAGPSVPANATKVNDTQLLPDWRIKHDTATPGTSTGAMAVVSDPSLSGQAQQFYTTYTNGGGELYSLTYGTDSQAHNFVYDAQVWIDSGIDSRPPRSEVGPVSAN